MAVTFKNYKIKGPPPICGPYFEGLLLQVCDELPLHPNQDTFPHHFPVHSRRAIAPLAPVQLSTFKVGSTWVNGSGDTGITSSNPLLPSSTILRSSNFRRTYLYCIYLVFSRPASFIKPHFGHVGPPPNGRNVEHFRCHQDAHLACEQKTSFFWRFFEPRKMDG